MNRNSKNPGFSRGNLFGVADGKHPPYKTVGVAAPSYESQCCCFV